MPRMLFVSNGHGEAAIAARIAQDVRVVDPSTTTVHFPLVGRGGENGGFPTVGPRKTMPSGGLVAMGNIRAFAADVRAGFPALWAAQLAFLCGAHAAYDLAVVVGDVYALALTFLTRLPSVFVGTAKSAHVAQYGLVERQLLRRANRVYVRDECTAEALRAHGVPAQFAGNVIVELHRSDGAALPGRWIGLLPGSREEAYRDAVRLSAVVVELARRGAQGAALLSVAPPLVASRFAQVLRSESWRIENGDEPTPYCAAKGGARVVFWTGELGALLRASSLVIGQAGTANEAAASAGIPLVALEDAPGRNPDWYRMRQRRLLGDALAIVPCEPGPAAEAVLELLRDGSRLARMQSAGPARMGMPGGARRIAEDIVALAWRGAAMP